eukprot:5963881-Pleurochrysis_carterae.AAC.1
MKTTLLFLISQLGHAYSHVIHACFGRPAGSTFAAVKLRTETAMQLPFSSTIFISRGQHRRRVSVAPQGASPNGNAPPAHAHDGDAAWRVRRARAADCSRSLRAFVAWQSALVASVLSCPLRLCPC